MKVTINGWTYEFCGSYWAAQSPGGFYFRFGGTFEECYERVTQVYIHTKGGES